MAVAIITIILPFSLVYGEKTGESVISLINFYHEVCWGSLGVLAGLFGGKAF